MTPSSQRIDKAVADLADMNRLISGYLELARTTLVEPGVRFDVCAMLEQIAVESSLVWSGVLSHFIVAGPLTVRQIMTNLIQNAQRYSGDGPVEITLESDTFSTQIVVRDRGPGIPEDQMEHVFRPFYRLESSRSQTTGGTGLGLAIVRQLVESNGWKINLSNREGGGLVAVLEIPVKAER